MDGFRTRILLAVLKALLGPSFLTEFSMFPSDEHREAALKRVVDVIIFNRINLVFLVLAFGTIPGVVWLLDNLDVQFTVEVEFFLYILVGCLIGPAVIVCCFLSARRRLRRMFREELQRCGVAICRECGYDLRGQEYFRCAECGAAFDPGLLLGPYPMRKNGNHRAAGGGMSEQDGQREAE